MTKGGSLKIKDLAAKFMTTSKKDSDNTESLTSMMIELLEKLCCDVDNLEKGIKDLQDRVIIIENNYLQENKDEYPD